MTKIALSKNAQLIVRHVKDLGVRGNISSSQLHRDVVALRESAIDRGQENLANIYWCMGGMFGVKDLYLKARKDVKRKDYLGGWNRLVVAERISKILTGLSPPELKGFMGFGALKHVINSMMLAYPFMQPNRSPLFLSSEISVAGRECSICGSPYKITPKCGHIPGGSIHGSVVSQQAF